jgi:PAS domain S-box-containing protein
MDRVSVQEKQSNVAENLERAGADVGGLPALDPFARSILDALPEALYIADASGKIVYFNDAAAALAGRRPEIGKDRWCVTWRLRHLDGTPIPPEESAVAQVVRDGLSRPIFGWRAVAERPDGTSVVIAANVEPLRDEAGRLLGAVVVIYDVSRQNRPPQDVGPTENAFMLSVLQNTKDCVKVLTLDGRLVSLNDGGRNALGIPDFEPYRNADFASLWPEADRPAIQRALEAARAGGTGRFTGYHPRVDDQTPRWWDCVVTAAPDAEGRPAWLLAVSRDITDLHRAEERQQALREELNHRVKNTLATVMSLAFQTARTATSLEAFNTCFGDRLQALSKTHDLLTRRSWERVQVSEVLGLALGDRLQSGAVATDGAPVEVAARAAVSLSLALRELATNAVRHGALSQPGGKLAIAWSQGADPADVELEWVETSTAEVAGPVREGFGLKLLRAMVERDLGGRLQLDFQPTGLKAAMTFKAAGATA